MHEALSDAGSAGREGRAYLMLVCLFFKYRNIILNRRSKNLYAGVDYAYEHKAEAPAPRTNTGHGT
jgi:hypothetical protein